ncbi:MAG: 2-oxoisovalerate dehydrogenase E1 component alpha subunit, partial [Myxococcota bacterium]
NGAAEIAKLNVVVASHGPATRLSHAAGLAWAGRNDGIVALCELGDGAVSDADFHCGVNFAAVLNAPVVYVVRTGGVTAVADRAEGYGIESMVIDGMDVEGVRANVAQAADRARLGGGPTLIEARVDRTAKVPLEHWTGYEADISAALASAERKL